MCPWVESFVVFYRVPNYPSMRVLDLGGECSNSFYRLDPYPPVLQLCILRLPLTIDLGTSLVVQWLRLCFPVQWVRVQSLVGKLRSHMPCGQKPKHKKNRSNIVTNSIKDFKNCPHQKKPLKIIDLLFLYLMCALTVTNSNWGSRTVDPSNNQRNSTVAWPKARDWSSRWTGLPAQADLLSPGQQLWTNEALRTGTLIEPPVSLGWPVNLGLQSQ